MAYRSHFEIMNVKDIRYTQYSIRDTFTDGIPLQYTIDMLKSGKIKPEDIKPIRAGKYNGHYRTIDNRRLYCFKQSNIKKIKVKYIPSIGNLPDFRDKYTSNNGGTSIKIRKEHTGTFFYCDVCDINMQLSNKMSHLNGKRHYENALQETFCYFYCDVCDINMQLSDKMCHLNGKRHHQNLKNQNADNSTKNKKLNSIRDEAIIACGFKPVDRNTTVTHTKSAKIATSNNKNVVNGKKYKKAAKTNAPITDMKKTVRKPPLSVHKSIKNKSENVNDIKELGSDANNKGIYDVKCCSEPVVSYKPKSNNVLRLRELQLEQVIAAKTKQVNAYKIKFDSMQQQIHNYEVKLRKMEQANIAIDIDLDEKKKYKFENKKNICNKQNICAVMGTLGVGVGAVYFLATKYI